MHRSRTHVAEHRACQIHARRFSFAFSSSSSFPLHKTHTSSQARGSVDIKHKTNGQNKHTLVLRTVTFCLDTRRQGQEQEQGHKFRIVILSLSLSLSLSRQRGSRPKAVKLQVPEKGLLTTNCLSRHCAHQKSKFEEEREKVLQIQ